MATVRSHNMKHSKNTTLKSTWKLYWWTLSQWWWDISTSQSYSCRLRKMKDKNCICSSSISATEIMIQTFTAWFFGISWRLKKRNNMKFLNPTLLWYHSKWGYRIGQFSCEEKAATWCWSSFLPTKMKGWPWSYL